MKRAAVLAAVITCLLFPLSALSYTAYVGVDASLSFGDLQGFQFDVSGTGLTLTQYFVGDSVDVNGVSKPGAIPAIYAWQILLQQGNNVSGFDYPPVFGDAPLSAGIILSLSTTSDIGFELSNFELIDYSPYQPYPGYYRVAENFFTGGAEYIFTATPVPIPPTLLLLGAGLAGLAAMRWRKGA
jgi:hypothetical protein